MKKRLGPNYLGKNYLEQCPKITIKELLEKVEKQLKEELLGISLDWLEIVKTKANYWWFRSWFKCQYCQKKVFTLYEISGSLKCRKCTGLSYKKQRYKGMLEGKLKN